jgi:hypothetical protein
MRRSRKMRLIDADEIMKALSIFNDTTNGNSHFLNGIKTAKELIEGAPTINTFFVIDKETGKEAGPYEIGFAIEEDGTLLLEEVRP